MSAFSRLALGALGLALAGESEARELRHPARGSLAFTVQVPDDWGHEVDPDRNLILSAADRSASFAFTFGSFSESLDKAAALMLQSTGATPPTGQAPASISGLAGYSFDSTMDAKPRLQLKLVIVRVRAKGFASVIKLVTETSTAEQRQRAEAVMQSVQIVGAAER